MAGRKKTCRNSTIYFLKDEIQEQLKKPLVEGELWYLVEKRWFAQLKMYLGLGIDLEDVTAYPNPGPIDNTPLLDQEGALKENLIDFVHYVLVPEEAWDLMVVRLGVKVGNQEIQRKVVKNGVFGKYFKVEVYFMELILADYNKIGETTKKKFCKSDSLDTIQLAMRRHFGIPDKKETRLWKKHDKATSEPLHNLHMTVTHAWLFPGQLLIIEQRNEDGTWPTEEGEKKMTQPQASLELGGAGAPSVGKLDSEDVQPNIDRCVEIFSAKAKIVLDEKKETFEQLNKEKDDILKDINNKERLLVSYKAKEEGRIEGKSKEIADCLDLISKAQNDIEELGNKMAELKNEKEKLTNKTKYLEEYIEMKESLVKFFEDKMQEELIGLRKQLQDNTKQMEALHNLDLGTNRSRMVSFLDKSIKEKETDLECPVCFRVTEAPIWMCQEMHLICSVCRPKVTVCPVCRVSYAGQDRRHRYAEKTAEELKKLKEERRDLSS